MAGVASLEIRWDANPFRGDKFEEAWLPAAEAALDYGATSWAFFRNTDGRSTSSSTRSSRAKLDFERYWYSEEIAEARAELAAGTRCRCCRRSTRSSARARGALRAIAGVAPGT